MAARMGAAAEIKKLSGSENSDLNRIPEPTAKDRERRAEYAQVRAILLGQG